MIGILFTDIETVPEHQYLPAEGDYKDFFQKRFKYLWDAGSAQWNEIYEDQAGFYAEFSKVVSVTIAIWTATKAYPNPMLFVNTIASRDEKFILNQLKEAIEKNVPKQLCGHNILEFDGPFLMRRFLINGIPIPAILDTMSKKTWDVPFIDTMKMWSGSAWNYKISQDHLAHLLGVQSSKGELDGSKIADLYYGMFDGVTNTELPFDKEREVLEKIGAYNAGDVVCNARIFAKLKGFKDIKDEDIFYIKTIQ